MASWFNAGRSSLKKSQYYVWFLGSKESEGLRGRDYVIPIMRELLQDCIKRLPNKITVQVSEKGLKLIQSVPTVNKYGKVKTEVMKFYIPAHSITYSLIGPAPYSDVVATVLLVFNPETKCPIHVHCYRCDSPETAAIMHSNLQILINRPESQRRIAQLEHRLVESGLLLPPRSRGQFPGQPRNLPHPISSGSPSPANYQNSYDNYRNISDNYAGESDETDYVGMSSEESDREDENSSTYRLAKLHQAVFRELKEKLRSEPPILLPPRDYSNTFRKSSDYPQKYEQRRQPNRKKVFNPPRQSPARENNVFWKKRGKSSDALLKDNSGGFRASRHLSNSVTALDEGALTSSTSGLGSDLSSSGGRFRYSIADVAGANPSYYGPEFSNDRELPETGLSARPRDLYMNSPFDDPPKLPNRNLDPLDDRERRFNRFFLSSENLHDSNNRYAPEQKTEKPGNFRMFGDTFKFGKRDAVFPHQPKESNLHFRAMESNWKRPGFHRSMDNLHFAAQVASRERPVTPESRMNWRSMVDPFGKRYEQSMKVDGFWRERAKQASWYIQPQNNKF